MITSFKDIARACVNHFSGLFKEENRAINVEVVKMATLSPMLVYKDDNVILMEEVSKGELHEVLHYFQKENIIKLNGWHVKFFRVFMKF